MKFSQYIRSLNQNGVSFNRIHAYVLLWKGQKREKIGPSQPCAGMQYSFGLGPLCFRKVSTWHSTVRHMMPICY